VGLGAPGCRGQHSGLLAAQKDGRNARAQLRGAAGAGALRVRRRVLRGTICKSGRR